MKKYHYVYEITHKVTGKKYIGARSSNKEPILDLLKYKSSSSDKDFKQELLDFEENFTFEIVDVFPTREQALQLEILLHNVFDVGRNPNFYNKAKQTSTGFCGYLFGEKNGMFGKTGEKSANYNKKGISSKISKPCSVFGRNYPSVTEAALSFNVASSTISKRCRENNKDVFYIDEYFFNGDILEKRFSKEFVRDTTGEKNGMFGKNRSGENSPLFGTKMSDETKSKIGAANSGKKNGMFGKTGENSPMFGMKMSDENKEKLQKEKKCEYCGKICNLGNFKRWHGENCKYFSEITSTTAEDTNEL